MKFRDFCSCSSMGRLTERSSSKVRSHGCMLCSVYRQRDPKVIHTTTTLPSEWCSTQVGWSCLFHSQRSSSRRSDAFSLSSILFLLSLFAQTYPNLPDHITKRLQYEWRLIHQLAATSLPLSHTMRSIIFTTLADLALIFVVAVLSSSVGITASVSPPSILRCGSLFLDQI
jgi:hypothetical protein